MSDQRLSWELNLSLSQHGRIKVRTTAEQAEAKRKEREKKLKIYKETTSRIYEKVCPEVLQMLELNEILSVSLH